MAKKRSDTPRGVEPPAKDDLQKIKGIGDGVEQRLNNNGIYTFASLAGHSPADIAKLLPGATAERIIKENWIGQAQKHAADLVLTESQQSEETVSDPPDIAEYEPTAITEKAVSVSSIATEPEYVAETSEGAEPAPIVVVEPQPTAITKKSEPTSLVVAESEPVPPEVIPPVGVKTGISGLLRLRKIEVIQTDLHGSQYTIFQDQPFEIHLTLDFTDIIMPVELEFHYKAYIHSLGLEELIRQKVGEVSGTIKFTDHITIHVDQEILPKGFSFLQAVVMLWPVKTETNPQTYLQTQSDGSLLHVI